VIQLLNEKEDKFESMLKFALMQKDQKVIAELKQWEEKAKGKHRSHQF
jgi:hypothetical protein